MLRINEPRSTLSYVTREGSYLMWIEGDRFYYADTPYGKYLIGGGLERGETKEACLRREAMEEVGGVLGDLEWLGTLEYFEFSKRAGQPLRIVSHLFKGEILSFEKPLERDHRLTHGALEDYELLTFYQQRYALAHRLDIHPFRNQDIESMKK